MGKRPILFSAPMVRAILAGTKTQTRRVVKLSWPKGSANEIEDWYLPPDGDGLTWDGGIYEGGAGAKVAEARCPYGQSGDRLWVRETHAILRIGNKTACAYRATCDGDAFDYVEDGGVRRIEVKKWRPSIFMFREASRLTLEVTGVRVERLQSISEEDAKAEGVESDAEVMKRLSHLRGADAARALPSRLRSARDAYRDLWLDINGNGSWDANPWVWVIEFKRVQP